MTGIPRSTTRRRAPVTVVVTVVLLAMAIVAVSAATSFRTRLDAVAATGGADPYHPDHDVDVEHYAFSLEVTDVSDEIAGRATIQLRATADSAAGATLNLVGTSGAATGMRVGAVVAVAPDGGSRSLDFDHDGDELNVAFAEPLQQGERIRVDVQYSGIPADGLVISTNKYGARTFFGDNWPNRARHWLPTVDHVSDKATVEWFVTAPSHYQVVASGSLIEATDLEGERRLTHYRSDVPLAAKVMVIGVARFAVEEAGVINGIPITSWVYPEDRANGFAEYSRAVRVLDYFISHIGPYPYAKLANVQSKTRYGGMENASNIFYHENSVSGTGSSEGLIAHEIAHQWFGDSVTEADWYHIWLSEGFATYFTQLYMEHTYGRDRMNTGLMAQRNAIVAYASSNPRSPVLDTTIVDLNDLLSTNSYQKGGWVLHMLRREIGDEAFWDGIRTYYRRHRDGNALTSDLRRAMEDTSGEPLSWFFDQWLRRAGQPSLNVVWSAGEGGKATITVEQTQPGPAFRFPLDVAFETGESAAGVPARTTTTVEVTGRTQTFEVDAPGAASRAVLDPDVWLLMTGEIRKR